MIKHFCDCCDREFKPTPGQPLGKTIKLADGRQVKVEIKVGRIDADICNHCLIDALQSLDDRPRPALKDESRPLDSVEAYLMSCVAALDGLIDFPRTDLVMVERGFMAVANGELLRQGFKEITVPQRLQERRFKTDHFGPG